MERAALPGRLNWQLGRLVDRVAETPRTTSLILELPDWPGHVAGQHVDVRLTAEDGYQVQRSYSIASPPEDGRLALTVERIDDGEVSPYLTDELRVGDQLELRGPIGGYFTWDVDHGGPLWLVAGGSGVVPLMAMLRHRQAHTSAIPAQLLFSAREPDDLIYRGELDQLAANSPHLKVIYTLTRAQPPDWSGYRRRIDKAMLAEVGWPANERPQIFVCGPTPLVEGVATALGELGHDPARIKTERFGPTGGS
ncbi:MAG: ferredoxin reductase [Chloroflexales bacterium]|nr:ferredoxin reductase [Chloroflexales bacterium]